MISTLRRCASRQQYRGNRDEELQSGCEILADHIGLHERAHGGRKRSPFHGRDSPSNKRIVERSHLQRSWELRWRS